MGVLLTRGLIGMIWLAGIHLLFAQTWTRTSAPANRWQSVASSADGTKLMVASGFYLYTSTNSGATWVSNNIPPYWWDCVASSFDGIKLVAGAWKSGPIYVSTNSGVTWTPTTAPNNYWGSIASSADGAKLIAAGTDGGDQRLYVSTNSGTTWAAIPLTNYWFGVACSANGDTLAATAHGLICVSTNFGMTWLTSTNSAGTSWVPGNSIAMSADGTRVIAITGNNNVYLSSNSGNTWKLASLPTSIWSSVASSADGAKLIAASQNGIIYTSTDFGLTWESNVAPGDQWQATASSANGNQLVAVSGNDFNGAVWIERVNTLPQIKTVIASGNQFIIRWIVPSTNCVLQENTSLFPSNWITITNTPSFNTSSLQYQVTLPISNGSHFFRLTTP